MSILKVKSFYGHEVKYVHAKIVRFVEISLKGNDLQQILYLLEYERRFKKYIQGINDDLGDLIDLNILSRINRSFRQSKE